MQILPLQCSPFCNGPVAAAVSRPWKHPASSKAKDRGSRKSSPVPLFICSGLSLFPAPALSSLNPTIEISVGPGPLPARAQAS